MSAQDTYTEVTRRSWGERIKGSIAGILFGFLLFFGSFVILWWNEGRAVKTARSLEEGAASVISVSAQDILSQNDRKLVHVAGELKTSETLTDDEFGISFQGIKLRREVEMYQWDEKSESKTEKKLGGAEETVTTYRYDKVWRNNPIDSGGFKQSEGHYNPPDFPFQSKELVAGNVSLGEFRLSPHFIQKLDRYEDFPIREMPPAAPESLKMNARVFAGVVYIGTQNVTSPQIGDVRIKFKAVKPSAISLIAQQSGNTFEPYRTKVGKTIDLLEYGTVPADKMFAKAQTTNRFWTWGLRFAGLLLMYLGLNLIFKPLVVVADVLPILGDILGMGIGLVAGIVSFVFSFITIAIAWIAYRPWIGGTLLIVAGGAALVVFKAMAKKRISYTQENMPKATSGGL